MPTHAPTHRPQNLPMRSKSFVAPLFVLSGLVAAATGTVAAAPVPAPDLAELQLRALNHRFVSPAIDPQGALLEAVVGPDFVFTDADGHWLDRTAFLARRRQATTEVGSRLVQHQVRIFGPVALVHAVTTQLDKLGQPTPWRHTDVHRWTGTAWQLVSVQDTRLREGVPVPMRRGEAPARPAWGGSDPTGDPHSVLQQLNDQYVNAFRQADVAWYDAHLAPDYVVVSGDGSIADRGAALSDFARPVFATSIETFPVGRVTIRRFADVALIHAENDYLLKDGRRGVSRYTDIWHWHDGRWQCLAAHITVHRAPSP
jgi:ketosteroid isomerase-like protein